MAPFACFRTADLLWVIGFAPPRHERGRLVCLCPGEAVTEIPDKPVQKSVTFSARKPYHLYILSVA